METMQSVREFYAGTTVLVTGGTGYLGKAIVEKILRSCTDVKRVYTLMRSKRGSNSFDRLEQLKSSQIFDKIRLENPKALDKLSAFTGDIAEANLGLNTEDMQLIKNTVNIVIHSAATVRFNEPIAIALNINVIGTRRLLDICKEIVNLKNIVHISTAYSNPSRKYVRERVYESKKSIDINWFINCVAHLPNDLAIEVMQCIHGFFPNTYTLTKYMAEQLVKDYRTKYQLPLTIVRPSIIGGSYMEPFPGWADNLNGVNACVVEFGRGTVGSVFVTKDVVMDVIPLDFVANFVLVAAWFDTIKPTKEIRVFNCTSGDRNGITWDGANKYIQKHCRNYPSKFTILYPACRAGDNYIIHRVLEIFHTFIPAYIADVVLQIRGKKPMMVEIQKKFQTALKSEQYFTTNQWQFECGNLIEMLEAVKSTSDRDMFFFDICTLNWDTYIRDLALGMQKYFLKVDMNDLARAKRKLKVLYAAWCLYYACIYGVCFYAIYTILGKVMK